MCYENMQNETDYSDNPVFITDIAQFSYTVKIVYYTDVVRYNIPFWRQNISHLQQIITITYFFHSHIWQFEILSIYLHILKAL